MHRMSMYVLVVFVCMCVSTHTSCIDYINIYLNAHVVRILCIHVFDISFCTDISLIHMVQNVTQLSYFAFSVSILMFVHEWV